MLKFKDFLKKQKPKEIQPKRKFMDRTFDKIDKKFGLEKHYATIPVKMRT